MVLGGVVQYCVVCRNAVWEMVELCDTACYCVLLLGFAWYCLVLKPVIRWWHFLLLGGILGYAVVFFCITCVIEWYCVLMRGISRQSGARQRLRGTVFYCVVFGGIVWFCAVLRGNAWFVFGIVWYCVVLRGIARYCVVLHGTLWHCSVLNLLLSRSMCYCAVLCGIMWPF